ncbi:MAG: DUF58 domain-containing protein [Lachnospiraceae bacterium]|nr:DUF58 domain-containing protein [Lachnospiraceae bacterium]
MNYDYLAKIRSAIGIYTKRKTSNILEGGFSSVFRGRSLEFDDLKEYDFGDNVHDIDWKSSSRTGKTLIRRYVPEKKHNVLFVGDVGSKMTGHTPDGEEKEELALLTFGTIAYLADRQGADINLAYAGERGTSFRYFRSGQHYLEELLQEYKANMLAPGRKEIAEVLSDVTERISKRMILVVITDIAGLYALHERLVKKVTYRNDMLVIRIDDAFYTGSGGFDVGGGKYIDLFFRKNKKLREIEEKERRRILEQARTLFGKYRIPMVTVSNQEEIIDKTITLLDQYRRRVGG